MALCRIESVRPRDAQYNSRLRQSAVKELPSVVCAHRDITCRVYDKLTTKRLFDITDEIIGIL